MPPPLDGERHAEGAGRKYDADQDPRERLARCAAQRVAEVVAQPDAGDLQTVERVEQVAEVRRTVAVRREEAAEAAREVVGNAEPHRNRQHTGRHDRCADGAGGHPHRPAQAHDDHHEDEQEGGKLVDGGAGAERDDQRSTRNRERDRTTWPRCRAFEQSRHQRHPEDEQKRRRQLLDPSPGRVPDEKRGLRADEHDERPQPARLEERHHEAIERER